MPCYRITTWPLPPHTALHQHPGVVSHFCQECRWSAASPSYQWIRCCCTCCSPWTTFCACCCCCTLRRACCSFCAWCHYCTAFGFMSGSTRPRRGSEASKLKFSIDVSDVVKSNIAGFVPSDDQFLAKVNHRHSSSIHYCGVRLEIKPTEEWEFANNKPKERA